MIRVKIETHIDGQSVIRKVNSDKFGKFAAAQWHRLYTPYVPWKSGHLATHVKYSPWQIEHTEPYARYIYHGIIYGPSFKTKEGTFRSPKDKPKHSTGREMRFKTTHNPLASAKWDEKAEPTQKPELIREMQKYVDSGRLNL